MEIVSQESIMVHIFNTKGPKSAPKRVSLPGSIEDPETSDQIDDLRHSDCNPDPSYTQRACENGQIMERILNYCDCFPSYDKQFEQYMEKKNLTARACNFFEHVRHGFCDYHLKYRENICFYISVVIRPLHISGQYKPQA